MNRESLIFGYCVNFSMCLGLNENSRIQISHCVLSYCLGNCITTGDIENVSLTDIMKYL